MKKIFVTMLMLAVLAFGLAQTCLADSVPVYLDGDLQKGAFKQNDMLYLPLRPVLDKLGISAEWNAGEQTVSVAMADGSLLHMYIGKEDARRVWPDGSVREYGFDGAPLLHQNAACVSVDSLCFLFNLAKDYPAEGQAQFYTNKLVYFSPPDKDTYILDLATGILTCRRQGQTAEQKLAELEIPVDLGDERYLAAMRTPAGNYLVSYSSSIAATDCLQCAAYYFIDGQSGQSHMICRRTPYTGRSAAPERLDYKDEFWFNGDSSLLYVQDIQPITAVYYDLAAMQAAALGKTAQEKPVYCYWAQAGQYLLLGDCHDYVLYDLQKEQGRILTDLLLTDEVKQRANELLLKIAPEIYSQPEELAVFWQRLGSENELPARTSHPCLVFSHYADGIFYFSLDLVYYVPNSENSAIHNVSIRLPFSEVFWGGDDIIIFKE